jgi:hypothetical protein
MPRAVVSEPPHPARRSPRASRPLYQSILRLQRFRPSGVQRILLIEGSAATGIVVALADIASAWVILILPIVVAGVVKFEDVVATALDRPDSAR